MRIRDLAAGFALFAAPALAGPTVVGFDAGLHVLMGPGAIAFATPASAAEATFVSDAAYGGGVMEHTAAFGNYGLNGLYFDTGALPNGGGSYINDYTVIYDLKLPQNFDWHSLIQTNESNSNDGDLYVEPLADGGGIGISGVYDGTVTPDAWHRLAFSLNSAVAGVELKKYIDGALVGTQNLGSGVDGRWSLYATNDPYFQGLYLFASYGGYLNAARVGGFLFEDRVYTTVEIGALGGASYGTLPEPTALALLLFGALMGLRARR